MLNNFFSFLKPKWVDILRGPIIATTAYMVTAVINNDFSVLLAIALFNGMTTFLLITIFIVWLILKRKHTK